MSSKKLIRTPLHLLRDLTGSLVSYFEEACIQVQQDAEKALTKLEKQRAKVQQKLITAQAKLEKAKEQGKSKAKNKAKDALADLETIYSKIQKQQKKILNYINLLKKDATKSLELSKDIAIVHERAKALLNAPVPKATTVSATKLKAIVTPKVATKATSTATPVKTTRAPTKTTTAAKPKISATTTTTVATKPTVSKAKVTPAKAKIASTPAPKKPIAQKAPTKTTAVNKVVTKPAVTKESQPANKTTTK